MRLYIIRHGQTIWNREGKIQGHLGTLLTEEGERVAKLASAGLRDVPFDLCISSPLQRALQTAEIILTGRDVPLRTDARIQEIGFGELEGREWMDPEQVPQEQVKLLFEDPLNYLPPAGGESVRDVCARTAEFLADIAGNEAYRDKNILISSHGLAIRAMLFPYYEEDRDNFWHGSVPPNCSVSILQLEEDGYRLIETDRSFDVQQGA